MRMSDLGDPMQASTIAPPTRVLVYVLAADYSTLLASSSRLASAETCDRFDEAFWLVYARMLYTFSTTIR